MQNHCPCAARSGVSAVHSRRSWPAQAGSSPRASLLRSRRGRFCTAGATDVPPVPHGSSPGWPVPLPRSSERPRTVCALVRSGDSGPTPCWTPSWDRGCASTAPPVKWAPPIGKIEAGEGVLATSNRSAAALGASPSAPRSGRGTSARHSCRTAESCSRGASAQAAGSSITGPTGRNTHREDGGAWRSLSTLTRGEDDGMREAFPDAHWPRDPPGRTFDHATNGG